MKQVVAIFAATFSATIAGATPSPLQFEPIGQTPEPVGTIDPSWQWLAEQKVRANWQPGDLHVTYPGRDVPVGDVLKEAGFNLVLLAIDVDRNNRSISSDLESRLPPNLATGRRLGLPIFVKWKYGSNHEDPYRRYVESNGKRHESTCCPLEPDYFERHIARWARRSAELGAQGFSVDTEMYESDSTGYAGPCFCDICFTHFLKSVTHQWKEVFTSIPLAERGKWVAGRDAVAHYSRHAARRIEQQYDSLRTQCQAINPTFLFGYAPLLEHIPGITRGLGTSELPCLIFSEAEYISGPRPQTWANVEDVRTTGLPGLYVSGHMILMHDPEAYARHALMGALYADGWWAWFGGALTTFPGKEDPVAFQSPYGRAADTTTMDYLDRLRRTHTRLESLLASNPAAWPAKDTPLPTPTVDVPVRSSSITMDGALDEAAWQTATRLRLDRTRMDELVTAATEFRICRDDKAIYIAATCHLPKGYIPRVPERGRDNALIWEFDGVEIFLAPGQSHRRYYQFMISARGDICDLLVDHDVGLGVHGTPSWSTNVQAASHWGTDRYQLEVRIPFADLGPTPKPGEKWNANVYRFVPDGAAWSPTFGGFHSPLRFGTLIFE